MIAQRWRSVAFVGTLLALACAPHERLEAIRHIQDAGQFQESIAPLRDLLASSPDLAEASYRLGRALVETGHASEAVWPLHRATASDDFRDEAGLLLARVFLATRNFDEALRATDTLLTSEPENTTALRLKGFATLAAGQAAPALEVADRLLAGAEADLGALELRASALVTLDRLDDAEAAYRRLAEAAAAGEEPGVDGRACLALAAFYAQHRKELDRAATQAVDCRDAHPDDLAVLQLASEMADRAGREDDATRWWRAAAESHPDQPALSVMLAQRLERRGAVDEARTILEENARRLDSASAWELLADFHRRHADLAAAETALARAAERGEGKNDLLQLMRADLLIDTGDIPKAEALAATLEDQSLRELMRARILAAQGSYDDALAAFDVAIPHWPQNPGARFLAGLTAERVGDFGRAIEEYRAAVRAGRRDTDAALALARLYLALGEPSYALEFGRIHAASRRPTAPEGLIVMARAATTLEDYAGAHAMLDHLARVPGWAPMAAVERAAVARAATGPTAAAAVITASGLDLTTRAHEPALRALVEYLLEGHEGAVALERIDAALSADPQVAAVHDIEARALERLGRSKEAGAAFERARSLDPTYAPAIAGLATLAATSGDTASAVRLYDEAAAIDPGDVGSRYRAAQLQLAAGDYVDAQRRLEEVLTLAPTHAGACNDLAWALAEHGVDLDRALALAERAVRLDASADTLDTRGWVQLKRGDVDQAIGSFERAVAQAPDAKLAQAHLAEALAAR